MENPFLKLAAERYSVRDFKPEQISDETLGKILEAARLAPTAVNFQPQKLYVVQNPELLSELNAIRPLFGAPSAVIVCYDDTVSWKNKRDGDAETGAVDASIVCTHMMLEAWELGVGSCWLGAYCTAAVKELFHIPEHIHPVAILALGYPSSESRPGERHSQSRNIEDFVEYII